MLKVTLPGLSRYGGSQHFDASHPQVARWQRLAASMEVVTIQGIVNPPRRLPAVRVLMDTVTASPEVCRYQ
jgi:hypothetical protein